MDNFEHEEGCRWESIPAGEAPCKCFTTIRTKTLTLLQEQHSLMLGVIEQQAKDFCEGLCEASDRSLYSCEMPEHPQHNKRDCWCASCLARDTLRKFGRDIPEAGIRSEELKLKA